MEQEALAEAFPPAQERAVPIAVATLMYLPGAYTLPTRAKETEMAAF